MYFLTLHSFFYFLFTFREKQINIKKVQLLNICTELNSSNNEILSEEFSIVKQILKQNANKITSPIVLNCSKKNFNFEDEDFTGPSEKKQCK